MDPTPVLAGPTEARVLGVLVEKQHTVPDTYPLSLNALLAGCNQKSSRDPVLELAESEVVDAIDELKRRTLVVESSGGRVARYAHNLPRVLQLPVESVSLLAILMLRGPQTPGELRLNVERLHRFSDTSSVEAFLEELATRPAGALVAPLPRQPGTRETRWAHLLCGAPSQAAAGAERERPEATVADAGDGWLARVEALEARLGALEALVARLEGPPDEAPR